MKIDCETVSGEKRAPEGSTPEYARVAIVGLELELHPLIARMKRGNFVAQDVGAVELRWIHRGVTRSSGSSSIQHGPPSTYRLEGPGAA